MKTNLDKLRKKFSRKGMYYIPLDVFNETCEAIVKDVDMLENELYLGGKWIKLWQVKQLLGGEGE